MTQPYSPSALRTVLAQMKQVVTDPNTRRQISARFAKTVLKSGMAQSITEKARVMYDYFRDPDEPWEPKLLIGAALLYLVVPTDLVPDWIPGAGFADDAAALAFVWGQMKDVLATYDARRRARMVGAGPTAKRSLRRP